MRSTASVSLLLASCASVPAASPDPLPLDEPDTSPSASLFVQRPEDVERFHAFQAQVEARQPASFHLERTARDGSQLVEDVTFDGGRYVYSDGHRRLGCLYLSGARLTGCRELPAEAVGDPDPLEHLGD